MLKTDKISVNMRCKKGMQALLIQAVFRKWFRLINTGKQMAKIWRIRHLTL